MSITVKPVTFMNPSGHRLFGMYHLPEHSTKETAVVILNPGLKSRVAPHRLYVKMAARFCELGYPVLRFDPHGVGDSEGVIEQNLAADFYGTVQVGRFVADTRSAMDWMEKECSISRFVLAGLCGGAITGLLAGAVDKRVDALIALGIPVFLESADIDQARYMTTGQLTELRRSYLEKLRDIRSWLRLLTMQSDYRLIFRSVVRPRLKKMGRSAVSDGDGGQRVIPPAHNNGNLNPHFPAAFHQMASTRKVLMVFSESDRLYWEFEEKYLPLYPEDFRKL